MALSRFLSAGWTPSVSSRSPAHLLAPAAQRLARRAFRTLAPLAARAPRGSRASNRRFHSATPALVTPRLLTAPDSLHSAVKFKPRLLGSSSTSFNSAGAFAQRRALQTQAASASAEVGDGFTAALPMPKAKVTTLPTGMRVASMQTVTESTVTVGVWIDAGSR